MLGITLKMIGPTLPATAFLCIAALGVATWLLGLLGDGSKNTWCVDPAGSIKDCRIHPRSELAPDTFRVSISAPFPPTIGSWQLEWESRA
jgi:hypothetical protein